MLDVHNIRLGELDAYKDKPCIWCGRTPKKTLINIEGFILHKADFKCIDAKACYRHLKKNARRERKRLEKEVESKKLRIVYKAA